MILPVPAGVFGESEALAMAGRVGAATAGHAADRRGGAAVPRRVADRVSL